MTMSMALPAVRPGPESETLRGRVRAFLDEQRSAGGFTPRNDAWMTAPDADFSRMLGARGWIGMTVPQRYGGQGQSPMARLIVTEELLAAGAPVAAHWIADRQIAPSLLRHGSPQQCEHYLPSICRGEYFFAIGMSEPDSGSDLASVRTRATATAQWWQIRGTKIWTTGAHYADAIVLLARTDGAAGDRHEGLSQFIVELPHPDVHVRPITSIDGRHHFNEVVFDDADVPHEALLGERGAGWKQVTAELGFERSGPERFLSTIPLLETWIALLRTQGAGPIEQRELGRLTARVWTLRGLSMGVAASLADGHSPDVAAAMVKDVGSTFEGDVVETIRRLVGLEPRRDAAGLLGMLADIIPNTPAFTLRGGTNEILRSVVARGLGAR